MSAARASMLLREVRGALRNIHFSGAADRLPVEAAGMPEALRAIGALPYAVYRRLPAAIRERVDKLRAVEFAAGVAAVADPREIAEEER